MITSSLHAPLLERLAHTDGKPLICLEVNPPRGTELEHIFSRLDNKLAGIDFLNVTDCALAKLKLGALPFAAILKARYGNEVMVNVSCRDRNVLALQSDLLAAWATGVRSIVALTGDAMTIGDMPERKGVFEVNSVGLLQIIAGLNKGVDLAGHELKGGTQFVSGVVVNPNVKNQNAELRRLERKREAGAVYALSQPVFDIEASKEFFKTASALGVHLFVGLLALKSLRGAQQISNVPGIKISEQLLASLEGKSDAEVEQFFLNHSLELAEVLKPYVRGFHVVSGTAPLLALKLAGLLVDRFTNDNN